MGVGAEGSGVVVGTVEAGAGLESGAAGFGAGARMGATGAGVVAAGTGSGADGLGVGAGSGLTGKENRFLNMAGFPRPRPSRGERFGRARSLSVSLRRLSPQTRLTNRSRRY